MPTVGERYYALAVKMAAVMGDLQEIMEMCEDLKNQVDDDGQPYFEMRDCVRFGGTALAAMVTYTDVYLKEEKKKREEEKK